MPIELLVLRLIHVLGGVFWVGAGVYSAVFLAPALGAAGPTAAAAMMAELQKRRMFTALPLVALLTMLSGLRLIWLVSGGQLMAYLATRSGHGFAAGGLMSIVAFAIAMAYSRPLGLKAGAMTAKLATAAADERTVLQPQVERLRRRAARSSASAVGLLVLSAALMAVSRYL